MYLFYRISDQKRKLLPGVTKSLCLQNFLEVFGRENLFIVTENCDSETVQFIENQLLGYEEADLNYCLEQAAKTNGTVYFVDDNFIHRTPAQLLITEGLTLGQYVSLYDMPDKYGPKQTDGEESKVMRTPSSHWKFTKATGTTFATTGEILREDWEVFQQWLNDPKFQLWPALIEKDRQLAVCLPGAASELSYNDQIEDWAIDNLLLELIDRTLLMDQTVTAMILNFQRQYPEEKMKLLNIIAALEAEVQRKFIKVTLDINV